jgi:hypothetical protein
MIQDELNRLYSNLATHDGERILCLACTANVNNPPILGGSIRLADGIMAGNLIFRETNLLPEIVKRFDGLVSQFFIDCEIKAGIDMGAATLRLIPSSRRHFFKPNDFTVESADEWVTQRVSNLEGAHVAIVGAGNIGAKLALRLAERGCVVRLVGRRIAIIEAVTQGLNAILRGSGAVIACQSILDACAGADVIIGCTPGTAAIDIEAVTVSHASLLLDVGNGCFMRDAITAAKERGLLLEVLSPTAGWEGFLRRYVATRKLQKGLGRRQIDSGAWIVSRGIMGATGDVLVDDISEPTRVIGVCNGMGDLLYGEETMQIIKSVEEYLGII